MNVRPTQIIGMPDIAPTSATITFPSNGGSTQTGFSVFWTVDQGSAVGDVYVDGVLATYSGVLPHDAGQASIQNVTPGDHSITVKVAGGSVTSAAITVHVGVSIVNITDNSGSGATGYITFDAPVTVNTGPNVDTAVMMDSNVIASIDGGSGSQVNVTFAVNFSGSGDTWTFDGSQPAWLNTPVFPNASSGNVQYN